MNFSNPVSAKRYSVKKKSKSKLKGIETLILYISRHSLTYGNVLNECKLLLTLHRMIINSRATEGGTTTFAGSLLYSFSEDVLS